MKREIGDGLRMQKGTPEDCLIDRDRRRMLWSFEGTNPRLLHEASRWTGGELVRHWTGSVYTPPRFDRTQSASREELIDVVGERTFDMPITLDELSALEHSCSWCSRTHRVQLTRLVLAHDGRRAIVLFRAPDAESVRLAYRRAGVVDRVWACRRIRLPAPGAQGLLEASR